MDDLEFLKKYNLQDTFYTSASGRPYASVIGTNTDGLLLNIQFGIGGFSKTEEGIALLGCVVVRSLIRGKSYASNFEWEPREGENRLAKKEFEFCITKCQDPNNLFEILESTTFFKDLYKSLKFHGCTLSADKLKEVLRHTLPKTHTSHEIICPKFAFNF
ncbi:MAG: hypothetical protein RR280_01345 [Bacteroidaceae bacterium]